jgi:ATP-binding cassette subfamily B protein
VLATPITVEPPRRPVTLPDGPLGVEVQALTYRLDGVPVLNGVDLEVQPDESVAIVGPTGAGKSVLTQLLVRLDDPDPGEVLVGGVNVRHVEPRALRSAATLVFQESFLFATTVRENIALDSGAGDGEIVAAARLSRADTFIRQLPKGYDTVVGERGVTLSGGQRQRVALARALVRQPRVLVLDDATSAVDPTIEAEILRGLRRELSTTLIVVAYRLSTIRLADRVLFLHGGRIAATGTHEELLASETRYRAIVQAYERGAA